MNAHCDNGYISDYLIHWTGKNGDEHGASVLSIIGSTLQLLLSDNCFHIFDQCHEVQEKMVCFTDVPLQHSSEHCKRYGRFGIVFHKLRLMNVGAQPVFYASHTCKRDMDTIFHFLQEQVQQPTLPEDLFRALHRHFYFIQRLSDGRADSHDAFYYEREWRLGEQTLKSEEKPYAPYTGRLVIADNKPYFAFNVEDVAFLIAPSDCHAKVMNPHGFPIKAYEDLIHEKPDER
jgi:Putative abortive phage resistance protein AbiGi, antitoxin